MITFLAVVLAILGLYLLFAALGSGLTAADKTHTAKQDGDEDGQ